MLRCFLHLLHLCLQALQSWLEPQRPLPPQQAAPCAAGASGSRSPAGLLSPLGLLQLGQPWLVVLAALGPTEPYPWVDLAPVEALPLLHWLQQQLHLTAHLQVLALQMQSDARAHSACWEAGAEQACLLLLLLLLLRALRAHVWLGGQRLLHALLVHPGCLRCKQAAAAPAVHSECPDLQHACMLRLPLCLLGLGTGCQRAAPRHHGLPLHAELLLPGLLCRPEPAEGRQKDSGTQCGFPSQGSRGAGSEQWLLCKGRSVGRAENPSCSALNKKTAKRGCIGA